MTESSSVMRHLPGSSRFRWQSACVVVGTAAMLGFTFGTPVVSNLNLRLQDWLLRVTTRENLPTSFLLVGIDDSSLGLDTLEPEEIAGTIALQLMKKGFPWSREVYALAAQKLLDAGAKLVILDLIFPGPNPGDGPFAEFLEKNPGRIVLGSLFDLPLPGENKAVSYRRPTAQISEAAGRGVGFTNLADKAEVRHIRPYATASDFEGKTSFPGEDVEPAMTTVAAGLLGKTVEPGSRRPLRFRYSVPQTVEKISLQDLFVPALWQANFQDGRIFKDRVVLIGPTAEGLKDYHVTPFGRLAGPEIQLHILAAMLRGGWLTSSGPWAALAAILAGALGILALAVLRRSALRFLLGLLIGAVVWLGICAAALVLTSHFLPVAPPLVTWLICGFLVLACDAFLEGRERSRLRGTLERYVSRDVVREIVDNPQSFLQTLGGQRKEIVAMFSDLKGFTSDTERLDPAEMVALLNEYFGEMVGVVFAHQGTLDKFMGDALMATWGCIRAATPQEDARHAVAAALKMKDRLAAMNASRRTRGATLWSAGIGICQGPAVFGNIGSQQKMEPTVIGDTVNLASRVEGLTRVYGCDILVDQRIEANARGQCEFLLVDEVRVKGRQKPEKLFFPHRGEDAAWVDAFASARSQYLAGDFESARDAFGKLSTYGPAPEVAARFMTRCEGFLRVPPDEDWEGVWDFVEK